VVKARIYMVNLLDFINFISETDNIQDVMAWTVGRKVTFQRRGGKVVRPLRPPLATGLPFRSNYGAILYRLRDIASYWSKIAKFL